MTETDWLNATEPREMLQFLRVNGPGDDRRWRLFFCGCCRRVWHRLNKGTHRVVETAERLADGLADSGTLERAVRAAGVLQGWDGERDFAAGLQVLRLVQARQWVPAPDPSSATVLLVTATAGDGAEDLLRSLYGPNKRGQKRGERRAQCELLRDVFGNPFRPLRPIGRSLLGWNNGLLRQLAQAAYEHRQLPSGHLDPSRLAVLADALLDAGCTDDVLLGHLREAGPHYRGCVAVDAVLGRE